jgi:outer membrane lipoprotein carrier protein
MSKSVAIFLIAAAAGNTWASGLNGLDSLESFVKNTQSGKAQFVQVTTAPAKSGQTGQTAKSKTTSGSFEFLRPNRFSFVYKKPFEQSIVSDGKTLWLHDVDLNQVSSRALSQALSGTPAAVIAAASSLAALQADFTLTNLAARADASAGVQWVEAKPKVKDGQLQSIQIGLKTVDKNGEKLVELTALEITDGFGQRSVMSFSQFEVNPALTAARFQFVPPPGADLLKQ